MAPRRAALALLAPLLLAAAPGVVPPAGATVATPDCDDGDFRLLPPWQHRNQHVTFDYLSLGNPALVPDKEVELAILAAAAAWTHQVNACGRIDATYVYYAYGTLVAEAGGADRHGNGRSEIFWACLGACDYVAYQISALPGECDIVLNPSFTDMLLPSGGGLLQNPLDEAPGLLMFGLPYHLPTILAHEMGHCIGLDHPEPMESRDNRVHTMSRGYCLSDPVVAANLERAFLGIYLGQLQGACGLTLSRGDMDGLAALFGGPFGVCFPGELPFIGGSCHYPPG